MRVHHLDCCTMCPRGRRHLNDAGHLVGHVLVLETDRHGLVLVDTGIGRGCVADLRGWMGAAVVAATGPVADPTRTAHHQLGRLGLDPGDVRHVVVTHLDGDHAGGLADFPEATVHVHGTELDAAVNPRSTAEKQRYRRRMWAHGPRWRTFRTDEGDTWNGFAAARPLATGERPGEVLDGVVTLGLPGHTRGHSLVAVDRGDGGWLVHAGDAYFHTASVHRDRGRPTRLLTAFERTVAVDRSALAGNHQRLADLASSGRATVVCAHDPSEYSALALRDEVRPPG
ncbi:MAG TPA: MBL fold metallo-hydrolase [Acidimicrobiales bacterium]|nr:MBL fold metallo-hydrolase [Acidimicrobiales bacterium]